MYGSLLKSITKNKEYRYNDIVSSNDTSYSVTGLANNAFGSSPYSSATTAVPPIPRVFWFGRTTVNVFYSNITSLGNTTDWGYAMRSSRANYNTGTASSATRAVQCGMNMILLKQGLVTLKN